MLDALKRWFLHKQVRRFGKNLGSAGPLVASLALLACVSLQGAGYVAQSEMGYEVIEALGQDTVISREDAQYAYSAISTLVEAFYPLLASLVGAGAVRKTANKRRDGKGRLSKPGTLSHGEQVRLREDGGQHVIDHTAIWRRAMNEDGLDGERAAMVARHVVFDGMPYELALKRVAPWAA